MVQELGAIEAARLAVITKYPRVKKSRQLVGQLGGNAQTIANYMIKRAPKRPVAKAFERRSRVIKSSDAF